jgi:urease accessory protein
MLMSTRPPEAMLPRFVRADGGVRVRIGATARGSAPLEIAESGGYRVRFLRGAACEGVLINTGGGMAGGDTMRIAAALDDGAAAVLTTQAAEKIYRSQGDPTTIAINLALGAASRLDWLPQEQILFDEARLTRRLDAALAPDASLLLVESAVFGRLAMGESVRQGLLRDRWRVRRGGRLVFAEEVRLDGAIADLLDRRALGGGARALATVLFVSPDAEAQRDAARAAMEGAPSEWGISALDGMLIARLLGADPQALRADLARLVEFLRGAPMPRSWRT